MQLPLFPLNRKTHMLLLMYQYSVNIPHLTDYYQLIHYYSTFIRQSLYKRSAVQVLGGDTWNNQEKVQ
jgi:hypothetical protein